MVIVGFTQDQEKEMALQQSSFLFSAESVPVMLRCFLPCQEMAPSCPPSSIRLFLGKTQPWCGMGLEKGV